VLPTVSGYVLIIMAIGLGMAAYNSASNILFIALSVLLASLIVSGILSWLNFQGICWRMLVDPPFRAGEECHVRVEVRNTKKFLPTYALSLNMLAQPSGVKTVLRLEQRLEPRGTVQLDFSFVPQQRGVETIRVQGVSSQFPFGFLRKTLGGGRPIELTVWPRRTSYRFKHDGTATPCLNGRPLAKPGSGSEFINLRAYRQGDSHRQVHWKASARLKNLVVQQFAAENHSGFLFSLQSYQHLWPDEVQFEHLCSFVSSLAEDLFRQERLHGVQINGGLQKRISRRSDLDYFQDQLATLQRVEVDGGGVDLSTPGAVTFEADPVTGINAYVRGQKAATA
jgi:uncharacterized protein (DUF58 family)